MLAQPDNPSQSQFLDCVRKACWSATAEGRGTALVVSGQLGVHQWNSLYLLMKEGTANGERQREDLHSAFCHAYVLMYIESTFLKYNTMSISMPALQSFHISN